MDSGADSVILLRVLTTTSAVVLPIFSRAVSPCLSKFARNPRPVLELEDVKESGELTGDLGSLVGLARTGVLTFTTGSSIIS